jgi:hypothetical protein
LDRQTLRPAQRPKRRLTAFFAAIVRLEGRQAHPLLKLHRIARQPKPRRPPRQVRAEREAEEKRKKEGRKKSGKKAKAPSAEPDAKAQRNFTDPDSRVLLTKDGYIQGYNAQAAVDGTAQIIVAHEMT